MARDWEAWQAKYGDAWTLTVTAAMVRAGEGLMTKAELLRALEPFGDDQCVFVRLHSDAYPDGIQVIIQGVEDQPPWHGGLPDRSNYLIGVVAHDHNKDLGPILRSM